MKFWNKNYSLVVIGQLISLFANNILHLALTLYILDLMGTGYAFVVTAVSMVPMVVLMPFGGILADRVNKKKIMVCMDIITGSIVVLTIPALISAVPVLLITLVLAALSVIEAFYTPCCQASIPFLQEPDNLAKGNAIVSQIGMGTNIIGAVLGGVVYGFFSIRPVLSFCIIAFLASAFLELFIVIPHVRPESAATGVWSIIKSDFRESYLYISKEQRSILKLIPPIAVLNFSITSMLTVAVPFLIRITLQMSSTLYGIALGLISTAAMAGGIVATLFSKKIQTRSLYKFLFTVGLSLLPLGFGFFLTSNSGILYALIIICLMVCEVCCSIFSIFTITAIELKTPAHLIGKVMSLIVAIGICAEPLGRGAYGLFFEFFRENVWIVLLASAVFIMAFAFPTKRPLAEMSNDDTREYSKEGYGNDYKSQI